MKNAIFLMAMACLLAGCTGNTKPDFKVAVQGGEKQTLPLKITTESDLPVVVKAQGNEALPIKIVPDEIAVGVFAAALLTAIFTCWAAFSARSSAKYTQKSVEATKLAAEGQLFVGLTREYVSDEIGKGIKELDDWWKKEGKAFKHIGEWKEKHDKLTEEQLRKDASEILERFGDKSQIISRVAIYFSTIQQLYKSGYVSREFAKSICEITRITEDVEYFMELFIWANGGGNKKVEKFKNELKEIRHIEGA